MLNEIKYKTKGDLDKDYIIFGSKCDTSWIDKYKSLMYTNDGNEIFVEIDNNSYRVMFGKIPSSRENKLSHYIYQQLFAEGKRGSESAKFLFKLITFFFNRDRKMETIQKLFDKRFDEKFIEENYLKSQETFCIERDNNSNDQDDNFVKNKDFDPASVDNAVEQNLSAIYASLEDRGWGGSDFVLPDNTMQFGSFSEYKDGFLKLLNLITTEDQVNGKVVIVYTDNSIDQKWIEKEKFKDKFSFGTKGLFLTTKPELSNLPEPIIYTKPPTKPLEVKKDKVGGGTAEEQERKEMVAIIILWVLVILMILLVRLLKS